MNEVKDRINTIGKKYEEKFGSSALLKAGFRAVLTLLIKKGVFTEEEIYTEFEEEIKTRIKKYKNGECELHDSTVKR